MNRAERRKRKSQQRRAIKDAVKKLRALRSANDKRARQRASDAQVSYTCSEAAERAEVLQAGQTVQERHRADLAEMARQKFAYGCGPGTLAGSDDL